jgi:hypothetical protein
MSIENVGASNDDDGQFLPVGTLIKQYLDYLTNKSAEIEEQKESRRYYHNAQWTEEQLRTLRKRKQPPVTVNRVQRKINGIVGLTQRMRQDPKAYPRTPDHDEGAELATATVRSVLDANDWKTRDLECVRQCAIEAVAGVELRLTEGDEGDPDIELCEILGDDFFYDARSVRYDFGDARFMGLGKWLDIDAAVELFPDKEELIEGLMENGSALSTMSDREFKFVNTTSKQVRLIEHWYKRRSKWCWAFYIGSTLLDEGVSPFFDEKNKTMPRFIMFAAAVDHDGDRYSFVRWMKDLQNEINFSHSKAMFESASRRVIADKGAVDDVERARREYSRPDGWIEKNPNKEIVPEQKQADIAGQFQFLEYAIQELDAFANINPATLSASSLQNLSGRAINLLQQPGLAEIGYFLLSYSGWKRRVYRAIWNTVQRFWTSERWLRVTDDEGVAQFVQVNGMGLDQYGRPMLVNYLGALDVDIIMDEGPDVTNMMADSFDVLSRMPAGSIPPAVMIELLPLQSSVKQKIKQLMQAPPPDPMVEQVKQLAIAGKVAEINKDQSTAEMQNAKAGATQATATIDLAMAHHLMQKDGLEQAQGHADLIHTAAKIGHERAKTGNVRADTLATMLAPMPPQPTAPQQPQGATP